ncbi:hypothetical protein NEOLEDRAFT_751665 [Neolentinus lepideus HHB14362 ss-1]|uniref:Uncharacterized protein n=1 Tax=Neolentinus lepideus HHB14362 ss-1 TaxID=1314782 RepID=A0A165PUW9_9AGAM|nr:hypothetical protein NEOLEDRAFT_751665 [Neolentinus lepideus HHB14362 ss-1]
MDFTRQPFEPETAPFVLYRTPDDTMQPNAGAMTTSTINTGINMGQYAPTIMYNPGMNFSFAQESIHGELHHPIHLITDLARAHGNCVDVSCTGCSPAQTGTPQGTCSNGGHRPVSSVPQFIPPRIARQPRYPCYNEQPRIPPHTMQEQSPASLHFTQHDGTCQPGIQPSDAYLQLIPPVVTVQHSLPQGLEQGHLQHDYGQQYTGRINYTVNPSPYAPMAAEPMWCSFQPPMAQAHIPDVVDFNHVGAGLQDARVQPLDLQRTEDCLLQHDAQFVSDRPPIHRSEAPEPELVTNWPPRRRNHSSIRFNPFEDIEEHRQASVVVGHREPVSPTSASTMSGLYTPRIDGIVDFTEASLLPYTIQNLEYEMNQGVKHDICTGGVPELRIRTWPTDKVQRANDIWSGRTDTRNATDIVPIGCASHSSGTPLGMLRRRPPTKGSRRLERRVRFAKMYDQETGKEVEVVVEREADKYLDLLEYLTYRATERVKNKASNSQDCDTLPLLPLWLHFPDLLPAVLHTHKEDISLLRLSGDVDRETTRG